MIEIVGIHNTYIVKKEDIKYIKKVNEYEGYICVVKIGNIEIKAEEYQKLKKILLGDDKE